MFKLASSEQVEQCAPSSQGNAACAAESEDARLESFVDILQHPVGTEDAVATSLQRTLTALYLSGVPLVNTSAGQVVRQLREILLIIVIEVVRKEFTIRPQRRCRPRRRETLDIGICVQLRGRRGRYSCY